MRCVILLSLALFSCPLPAALGNTYPIVLVHGFTGWGPGEMGDSNYWGGRESIRRLLSEAGHPAHEGVVGPLASNWDRACELYAYIKGGRIDYGAGHARQHGHERFGRHFDGLLLDWLLSLASYMTDTLEQVPPYDFKLDQWGLQRRPGETEDSYRTRVLRSDIWYREDISVFDLTPPGAQRLNAAYPAVDSVYYFSWATRDSEPDGPGGTHVPAAGMKLALAPPSLAIGSYRSKRFPDGTRPFDASWWPNDGVVNTRSMTGPTLGSTDRILQLGRNTGSGALQPGVWHYMGELRGWDHLDIIGQLSGLDYRDFYLSLAKLLASLPTTE